MGSDWKKLFEFDRTFLPQSKRTKKLLPKFALVGVDEAGRGPWAGPVVACACVLPLEESVPHLADSKKLSPEQRKQIFEVLIKKSAWGIGIGSVALIDSKNILRATFYAMQRALANLLSKHPELVPKKILVDGPQAPNFGFPQVSIVRGDSQSASIAAASILAKVTRDRIMAQIHRRYPHYGFLSHKGYGTKQHRENLFRYGPSPIHRKSFSPVRQFFEG